MHLIAQILGIQQNPMKPRVDIRVGDCRELLQRMPRKSVHCCVTSPPYFGLRDYGMPDQMGLEPTPDEFVTALVGVFREVRRVLRDDGTLWLNLGDSYSGSGKGVWDAPEERKSKVKETYKPSVNPVKTVTGLKQKDLIGIPWRVAFALQTDGWYLRQDIIWCLSGGAIVYARTPKGDMPVPVKDLVRLKPHTVKLWNGEKWTQVLGWGESNDTTERVELVLRSGERIGCTGGHLWPTQRGNVDARSLRIGDTISTCGIPEPENAHTPGSITQDALWFVGLFLAEGSRSEDTIQLSLCSDEIKWLPKIKSVARHFGGSCTHTIKGGSLSVRVYGRLVSAAINSFVGGQTAKDKHMTNAVWSLPNNSVKSLIRGYLDGDGHHDNGNGRWRLGFCRNYALERDLRTAAARLGATITLKPCTATYQGGSRPAFKGEWRWERSGHFNEKDRGEVIEIRASRARKFWDIAVEDEPHLFALSSGVLTHNCKPNPMPESVRDRCTKAHEYIFLLSKGPKYYFDSEAMKEPGVCPAGTKGAKGSAKRAAEKGVNSRPPEYKIYDGMRNRRSVWTVATKPYKGAHFATFPPELIRPCVLAGCPAGGTVLDPFGGSGTTGQVALEEGRNAILCELNPAYAKLAQERTAP